MVVVGSVNTDLVLALERLPGAGETVGDAELEVHPGGKGANQAAAAALCGAETLLVARVGDDAAGEERRRVLAAAGVDVRHVRAAPALASGTAVVLRRADGENAIVVAPGANAALGPAAVEEAAADLQRAAVVVAQLEVPLAAVARAVSLAGERALVLLNAAPAQPLPEELWRRIDVLVVNEHEAALLADTVVGDPDSAATAGQVLEAKGTAAVIVTLGGAGAVVVDPTGVHHEAAPPVHVVDTTGAGDAFVGALAAALARGDELVSAVKAAVLVGSATATYPGATPRRVPAPLPAEA